jgi:nitroimidazol reductase NimA-like FMN-containing flavoprotein (pyridoxamine 5'-phosphate oxidase superfamily)
MPGAKRPLKTSEGRAVGPAAGRPFIPDAAYGVPTHARGLLPWSHVVERLTQAMCYWVSTVSADGRPHATPVDGLWLDDALYFGGSPQTRRSRNLASNPAVCVHLESGSDVVIVHGDALLLRNPDRPLTVRLSEASARKYGYGPKPEDYDTATVFVLRPRTAFAWKQFPRDATRWRLPGAG